MMHVLVWKVLRDLRWPLLVVASLLAIYECLFVKFTQRITAEVLPEILRYVPIRSLEDMLFRGPGQILQTLIGGEAIDIRRPLDVLSIGYMNPEALLILCIWAIGRSAGAIAGEIDRGTMELLLAQPLTRTKVILAHFLVDVLVIPLLCLSMWGGTWLGVGLFGDVAADTVEATEMMRIDPMAAAPALTNVGAFVFALSGTTLWLSARGRFRSRVLGAAVLLALVQFLINVIGQLLPSVAPLRPFTLFYYYQPQQIMLRNQWSVDLGHAWHLSRAFNMNVLAVLGTVGATGYALALWTFRRRDVPAPL